MNTSNFNADRVDGGWIIETDTGLDANGCFTVSKRKIIVKDNEVVKQFKEFVERTKPQVLNEG